MKLCVISAGARFLLACIGVYDRDGVHSGTAVNVT
jgi:hypothetical protein